MTEDEERRRREGAEIVAGYLLRPQTDAEIASAMAAAVRSIEEEPWPRPCDDGPG